MNKTLTIEGMTCGHCTGTVEKALRAVPGVTDVKVDLSSKSASLSVIEGISNEVLINAVTDTGFEVTGIS